MRRASTRTGKPSPAEPETAIGPSPDAAAGHPGGEWLTDSDVSALFRIAPGTLRYWRSSGSGPPYHRLAERTILYRRSDVEAWLAQRIVRPASRVTPAGGEGSAA